MDNISFIAAYGSDQVEARIQQYWVDTYYLFGNSILRGQITLRKGSWSFNPTKDEFAIYGDDLMVLTDLIEKQRIV